MISIRQLAGCIGLDSSGSISILGDFFGFFRRTLPPDPTGAVVSVSLKQQVLRLKSKHYHLNVIAVGVDNFTDAEDQQLDYSIFRFRNIYNQVGVGIGRVRHYGISVADAGGLDSPTTEGNLEEITERWTANNNGIDLFFPFNMNVPSNSGIILGMSAVDGPCDKNAKGMTGSVSGLWGSEQTSRTSAHEVGHYLSLTHRNSDPDNLMCQSSLASSTHNSVELTTSQGNDIKDHCFMQSGC